MGEFDFVYFGGLKYFVLKEIPWGGLGIFVDVWYLCVFFNMDYTSDSYFLKRVNKVIGVVFKSSGEAYV